MTHKEYATAGLKLNTQIPRSLQRYSEEEIKNISIELGLPKDFYTKEYRATTNRYTINPIYKSDILDFYTEKYNKSVKMQDRVGQKYYGNLINLEYSRIVKNLRLEIINNS